jgi:hypothetical protein
MSSAKFESVINSIYSSLDSGNAKQALKLTTKLLATDLSSTQACLVKSLHSLGLSRSGSQEEAKETALAVLRASPELIDCAYPLLFVLKHESDYFIELGDFIKKQPDLQLIAFSMFAIQRDVARMQKLSMEIAKSLKNDHYLRLAIHACEIGIYPKPNELQLRDLIAKKIGYAAPAILSDPKTPAPAYEDLNSFVQHCGDKPFAFQQLRKVSMTRERIKELFPHSFSDEVFNLDCFLTLESLPERQRFATSCRLMSLNNLLTVAEANKVIEISHSISAKISALPEPPLSPSEQVILVGVIELCRRGSYKESLTLLKIASVSYPNNSHFKFFQFPLLNRLGGYYEMYLLAKQLKIQNAQLISLSYIFPAVHELLITESGSKSALRTEALIWEKKKTMFKHGFVIDTVDQISEYVKSTDKGSVSERSIITLVDAVESALTGAEWDFTPFNCVSGCDTDDRNVFINLILEQKKETKKIIEQYSKATEDDARRLVEDCNQDLEKFMSNYGMIKLLAAFKHGNLKSLEFLDRISSSKTRSREFLESWKFNVEELLCLKAKKSLTY